MPVLVFGDQTRTVGPGVLTIGSAPESAWRIEGHDLELIHAVVVPELGGRTLISAGSRNAIIHVNGARLADGASHELMPGDKLRVGVADLVFRQHARAVREGEPAYLYDRHRNRLYRLDRELTAIGRDTRCGIFIQDPEVSRNHAEIVRRGGAEYTYVVVPKTAVTLRNGERVITQAVLEEGDELTVGRTKLRFSWDAPRGTGVSAPVAPPAGAARAARLQTTYMGAVETRERYERTTRRKLGVGMVVAFVLIALTSAIVVGYTQGTLPAVNVGTARGMRLASEQWRTRLAASFTPHHAPSRRPAAADSTRGQAAEKR